MQTARHLLFLLPRLLLMPLSVGAQEAAEIHLIDEMAIEAPTIYLGAIATITSDNPHLQQRLASLEVGHAPNLNNSRQISTYKIRALLQRAGFDNVHITGSSCTVTTHSREMHTEEIKSLIDKWLKEHVPKGQDIDRHFVSVPKSWQVPCGEDVEIRIHSNATQFSGPYALRLQAVAGGRSYATTRARLKLESYTEALVMIRPLKRGEKLSPSHLERRRCTLGGKSGMELVDETSMLGMEAKRDLPVGYQPTIRDFAKPVTILRGSLNRIILMNGALKMKVDGAIALQDGREGETILFENPMNKQKPLRAQVMSPGLALIKINQVTRM